jgi:diguanylate cyclase (GGDEF)-like protein
MRMWLAAVDSAGPDDLLRERIAASIRLHAHIISVFSLLLISLDWFLIATDQVAPAILLHLAMSLEALRIGAAAGRAIEVSRVESLGALLILEAGIINSLLCWLTGGTSSAYFGGLCAIFIVMGSVLSATVVRTLKLCAAIYAVYMLPTAIGIMPAAPGRTLLVQHLLLVASISVGLSEQLLRSRLRRDEVVARQLDESRLRELARIANTDELTGLRNRRSFSRLAEREFRSARLEGQHLSLLMIDIDHFKAVNDRFGHLKGDQTLLAVAERITAAIRGSDIAARYGGEEFAILLPRTTSSVARAVADRIRSSIADAPLCGAIACTVSIGVAAISARVERWSDLVARADAALYDAKREGRNRVVRPDSGRFRAL